MEFAAEESSISSLKNRYYYYSADITLNNAEENKLTILIDQIFVQLHHYIDLKINKIEH